MTTTKAIRLNVDIANRMYLYMKLTFFKASVGLSSYGEQQF